MSCELRSPLKARGDKVAGCEIAAPGLDRAGAGSPGGGAANVAQVYPGSAASHGGRFEYLDLLGKIFQYGGRGPDAYDCYGLVIETRRRAGLFVPEDYLSTHEPHLVSRQIQQVARSGLFRELDRPRPFCLVTFKIHPLFVTHIGMVLDDAARFIHILPRLRVALERLDSPVWRHRVDGFWETAE